VCVCVTEVCVVTGGIMVWVVLSGGPSRCVNKRKHCVISQITGVSTLSHYSIVARLKMEYNKVQAKQKRRTSAPVVHLVSFFV
jgi:hypothetical protein